MKNAVKKVVVNNITGLSAAISFNTAIINKIQHNNLVEQIVIDTVSLIRKYAPVDTGRLMESIRYEKKGNNQYVIIVDVPYALFMEYGTKFFPKGNVTPNINNPMVRTSKSGKSCYFPFIRPALWQINNLYPEYVKSILFKIRM